MMKRATRLWAVLMAAVLLWVSGSCALAASRKDITGTDAYVSAYWATVYDSPSLDAKEEERVPYGKSILRVAVKGQWAMVYTTNKVLGYCLASELTLNNPNRYNTTVYSQQYRAPVYLRPDLKSPLMGHLDIDESATLVAILPNHDWMRIERDGFYGYIQRPRMDYKPYYSGSLAWVSAESVVVYFDSDTDCVFGTLYFGQKVRLVSKSNGWAKIRSNSGLIGFCSASALSGINPNAFNQTVYTQVSGNFLFTNSTDLGGRRMIAQNEEMTLLALDTDQFWARVKYKGAYYYVPYVYLGTERRLGDYKEVYARQGLHIREGAKESSEVVATIPAGTHLWLMDAADNWVKVSTLPDGAGNVYMGFVEIKYLM